MRDAIIAVSLFIFIIVSIFGAETFASIKNAQVESKLYNEKFGTHYSTSDFYWAGATIKNRLHNKSEETFNLNVKANQ